MSREEIKSGLSPIVCLPDMQGSGAVRDLREAANDVEWRVAV